jgi:hypothetical protein
MLSHRPGTTAVLDNNLVRFPNVWGAQPIGVDGDSTSLPRGVNVSQACALPYEGKPPG